MASNSIAPDASGKADRPPSGGRSLLKWCIALGAMCWLVGFAWYGGALALLSDDWPFIFRNPETRKIVGSLFEFPPFFWRPFFHLWQRLAVTGLSEHPRAMHLLAAALHALTCITLYLVARRLRLSVLGSSMAALLALTCPIGWEVPFWPTGVPTGMGCGLMLVLIVVGARVGHSTAAAWRWALMVAGCAGMAFAIPCFNEQPAAGILAMPIAGLASGRKFLPRRMLVVWMVCLAAVGVYVSAYWAYGPGGRGEPGTIVHLGEVYERVGRLGAQVRTFVFMNGFRGGAAETGWMLIRGSVLGWLAVAGAAACAAVLVRGSVVHRSEGGPTRAEVGRAVLLGCAISLSSWLPVFVVRGQGVEPRIAYMGVLGLALALGAIVDARVLCSPLASRGVLRGVLVGGMLGACGLGTIITLGIQHAWHIRAGLDETESSTLRTAVPNPRAGAIIVPLRVDTQTTRTRSRRYDTYLRGPLEYEWSATKWVQREYRRSNVRATFLNTHPVVIVDAEARGLVWPPPQSRSSWALFPRMPTRDDGSVILRWDAVIPIVIDSFGNVLPVDRVIVERSGAAPEVYAATQVAALHAAGTETYTVTLGEPAEGTDRVRFERSP